MGLTVNSYNKRTGFTLHINSLPLRSISGTFSIAIDDINYIKNAIPFVNLSAGKEVNIICFEQKLLKDLETLTLRMSIYFEFNK